MSKNLSNLSGRKGLEDNLFDRLGNLVQERGQASVEELEQLADEFLVGTANLYGTATFYDFLKPANQGKKVYICNGSVCMCAGTQDALRENLLEHFKEDEIGSMCCLGRCHENSAFHYNGKNYSGEHASDLNAILGDKGDNTDSYTGTVIGTPVLMNSYEGLEKHYDVLRSILQKEPEEVLAEIKASGIRGRGGAGFPMGLKLEFCRKAEGDTKFIICNADEGDPGAFSDRWLLEQRPHHLLFGMIAAGYAIGAGWGVVYIRAEYPESVDVIEKAIGELYDNGLLGDDIAGSGFNFHLRVIKAAGSYICGEETALINSIEGQRPEVRVRPPYPAQQGLFGKPTVVNNVETLAALHYILSHGGERYARIGTDSSKGTKLVCLDSRFVNPGLYEVEMGTPLKEVVYTHGGGFVEPVKALHIGGPLGGMVPVGKIESLTLDFESFKSNGFLLGHASVVAIPERFPMAKYLEHLFAFASDESCGKCFPCRLGTKRAEEMFHKALHSDYKIPRVLIDDLLHTLETGSLCAHGGGIPLPVRNALQYFDGELREVLD